jgi:hypothetical protein
MRPPISVHSTAELVDRSTKILPDDANPHSLLPVRAGPPSDPIPEPRSPPSPYNINPSQATPFPGRGRGIPPRAPSTQHSLPRPSGSVNAPLDDRRRGDPWAYSPPPVDGDLWAYSPPPMASSRSPVSYRDHRFTEDETMFDDETSQSEDEDDSDIESDAGAPAIPPFGNFVGATGSSD